LHYASREGLLTIVETLTSFGCRMDVRNKADATALHLAARHGHTEIARFLCLAGLDINIQDKVSVDSVRSCFFFYQKSILNRMVELLVN
jgi:ankyrin repeat protein